MNTTPVSIGIPTFGRNEQLLSTLEHLAACDPQPAEVIVHVDGSDGEIERKLAARFPLVRILSSKQRVGPGGGRHRCIQAATQPFFASFDDDSWPVDPDFLAEVVKLFTNHPHAAVLGATVYFPSELQPSRLSDVGIISDYCACGCAIRVEAYRQTTGFIDRPWTYGIEEEDLSMQVQALEWQILQCRSLRVFHNTQLSHHSNAEIVASSVQNIALRAFLRFPVTLWPWAILQLGNKVFDCMKRGQFAGIGKGLLGIPATLAHYAPQRRQLPAVKVRSYLKSRRRVPV